MSKLSNELARQLQSEHSQDKKDAEDCIVIYEFLKKVNEGSIWESEWQVLVDIRYVGRTSLARPSQIGHMLIKGIKSQGETV